MVLPSPRRVPFAALNARRTVLFDELQSRNRFSAPNEKPIYLRDGHSPPVADPGLYHITSHRWLSSFPSFPACRISNSVFTFNTVKTTRTIVQIGRGRYKNSLRIIVALVTLSVTAISLSHNRTTISYQVTMRERVNT